MRLLRNVLMAVLATAGCASETSTVTGPPSRGPDGGVTRTTTAPDAGAGPLDGGTPSGDGGVVEAPSDAGGVPAAPACPTQPLQVVSTSVLGAVAADDSRVYYATGNVRIAQLWSVSNQGGTASRIGSWTAIDPNNAGGKPNPVNIAADATNVFFGNEASVVRVAKDGSSQQLLWLGFPSDEPQAAQCLGVDRGYVYWCQSGGGQLMREPVTGGAISQVAKMHPFEGQVRRPAFDANDVFEPDGSVILRIAGGDGPVSVATHVLPLASTPVPGPGFALAVAVDDQHLFIGVGSFDPTLPTAIEVADKYDGAPARILYTPSSQPRELTSDGDHLYWNGGDAIWRMNKDGTDANAIVPHGVSRFVVAGDSLYFIADGIWRACK